MMLNLKLSSRCPHIRTHDFYPIFFSSFSLWGMIEDEGRLFLLVDRECDGVVKVLLAGCQFR